VRDLVVLGCVTGGRGDCETAYTRQNLCDPGTL